MPKFRKKPVVIEAVQYSGNGNIVGDVPEWLWKALESGDVYPDGDKMAIKTLEGDMTVSWDDWIIRGISGELYPCKPEIFAQTYELVD